MAHFLQASSGRQTAAHGAEPSLANARKRRRISHSMSALRCIFAAFVLLASLVPRVSAQTFFERASIAYLNGDSSPLTTKYDTRVITWFLGEIPTHSGSPHTVKFVFPAGWYRHTLYAQFQFAFCPVSLDSDECLSTAVVTNGGSCTSPTLPSCTLNPSSLGTVLRPEYPTSGIEIQVAIPSQLTENESIPRLRIDIRNLVAPSYASAAGTVEGYASLLAGGTVILQTEPGTVFFPEIGQGTDLAANSPLDPSSPAAQVLWAFHPESEQSTRLDMSFADLASQDGPAPRTIAQGTVGSLDIRTSGGSKLDTLVFPSDRLQIRLPSTLRPTDSTICWACADSSNICSAWPLMVDIGNMLSSSRAVDGSGDYILTLTFENGLPYKTNALNRDLRIVCESMSVVAADPETALSLDPDSIIVPDSAPEISPVTNVLGNTLLASFIGPERPEPEESLLKTQTATISPVLPFVVLPGQLGGDPSNAGGVVTTVENAQAGVTTNLRVEFKSAFGIKLGPRDALFFPLPMGWSVQPTASCTLDWYGIEVTFVKPEDFATHLAAAEPAFGVQIAARTVPSTEQNRVWIHVALDDFATVWEGHTGLPLICTDVVVTESIPADPAAEGKVTIRAMTPSGLIMGLAETVFPSPQAARIQAFSASSNPQLAGPDQTGEVTFYASGFDINVDVYGTLEFVFPAEFVPHQPTTTQCSMTVQTTSTTIIYNESEGDLGVTWAPTAGSDPPTQTLRVALQKPGAPIPAGESTEMTLICTPFSMPSTPLDSATAQMFAYTPPPDNLLAQSSDLVTFAGGLPPAIGAWTRTLTPSDYYATSLSLVTVTLVVHPIQTPLSGDYHVVLGLPSDWSFPSPAETACTLSQNGANIVLAASDGLIVDARKADVTLALGSTIGNAAPLTMTCSHVQLPRSSRPAGPYPISASFPESSQAYIETRNSRDPLHILPGIITPEILPRQDIASDTKTIVHSNPQPASVGTLTIIVAPVSEPLYTNDAIEITMPPIWRRVGGIAPTPDCTLVFPGHYGVGPSGTIDAAFSFSLETGILRATLNEVLPINTVQNWGPIGFVLTCQNVGTPLTPSPEGTNFRVATRDGSVPAELGDQYGVIEESLLGGTISAIEAGEFVSPPTFELIPPVTGAESTVRIHVTDLIATLAPPSPSLAAEEQALADLAENTKVEAYRPVNNGYTALTVPSIAATIPIPALSVASAPRTDVDFDDGNGGKTTRTLYPLGPSQITCEVIHAIVPQPMTEPLTTSVSVSAIAYPYFTTDYATLIEDAYANEQDPEAPPGHYLIENPTPTDFSQIDGGLGRWMTTETPLGLRIIVPIARFALEVDKDTAPLSDSVRIDCSAFLNPDKTTFPSTDQGVIDSGMAIVSKGELHTRISTGEVSQIASQIHVPNVLFGDRLDFAQYPSVLGRPNVILGDQPEVQVLKFPAPDATILETGIPNSAVQLRLIPLCRAPLHPEDLAVFEGESTSIDPSTLLSKVPTGARPQATLSPSQFTQGNFQATVEDLATSPSTDAVANPSIIFSGLSLNGDDSAVEGYYLIEALYRADAAAPSSSTDTSDPPILPARSKIIRMTSIPAGMPLALAFHASPPVTAEPNKPLAQNPATVLVDYDSNVLANYVSPPTSANPNKPIIVTVVAHDLHTSEEVGLVSSGGGSRGGIALGVKADPTTGVAEFSGLRLITSPTQKAVVLTFRLSSTSLNLDPDVLSHVRPLRSATIAVSESTNDRFAFVAPITPSKVAIDDQLHAIVVQVRNSAHRPASVTTPEPLVDAETALSQGDPGVYEITLRAFTAPPDPVLETAIASRDGSSPPDPSSFVAAEIALAGTTRVVVDARNKQADIDNNPTATLLAQFVDISFPVGTPPGRVEFLVEANGLISATSTRLSVYSSRSDIVNARQEESDAKATLTVAIPVETIDLAFKDATGELNSAALSGYLNAMKDRACALTQHPTLNEHKYPCSRITVAFDESTNKVTFEISPGGGSSGGITASDIAERLRHALVDENSLFYLHPQTELLDPTSVVLSGEFARSEGQWITLIVVCSVLGAAVAGAGLCWYSRFRKPAGGAYAHFVGTDQATPTAGSMNPAPSSGAAAATATMNYHHGRTGRTTRGVHPLPANPSSATVAGGREDSMAVAIPIR